MRSQRRLVNPQNVPTIPMITDLSAGLKYATAIQLLFTETASTSYYNLYLGGFFYSTISGSGDYIVNLNVNTTYQIQIMAVNSSGEEFAVSNTISQKTNIVLVHPMTGLWSYYKLQDDATDSFSNKAGVIGGTVSFADGKIGRAANFDGGSYSHINLGDIVFNIVDAFSLNVWFNTTTTILGQFIARDHYLGSLRAWQWRLSGGGLHAIRWITGGANRQLYTGSSSGYNDGTWRMATFTFSTTNGMRLYMNGKLVIENKSYNTQGIPGTGQPILMGANENANNTKFIGKMDEVSMYEDYELTPGEVSDLHNNGNGQTI